MAVTLNSNVIRMTAAGDEVAMPLWIKSIRWDGAAMAGDDLQITESSLGNPANVILESLAAGANNEEHWLQEQLFRFGLEVNVLDSGEVWVYLMDTF